MLEEIELIFDGVEVYLPRIVDEENKRNANERERIENENERIENENERQENEENRDAKIEELIKKFGILKADVEASLTKTSYMKEYKNVYITEEDNTDTFDLSNEYTELCLLEVRVNGWVLDMTAYTIDKENLKVILTKPLDKGATVEIMVIKLVTLLDEDYDKLSGYTPIRGVDYWTTEDISFMQEMSKEYIDTQLSATVDEINGEEV